MACTVTNIRIEPANAFWSIEEAWCVDTVADVSSSLGGTYFKLGKAGQSTYSHYLWLDDGIASDPAPAGLTMLTAVYAPNDSAATIAGLIQASVDASSDFVATVSGNHVTIYCAAVGESAGVADATAGDATGFTFTQAQSGGDEDLGLLDGNIEISFTETLAEVKSHQTGSSLIADLRQGVSAEVKLTLKESDTNLYKAIFGAAGGTDSSGSTEVFGWGKSKQGSNTIVQARRLVLNPVRLGTSNKSEDVCFWKAYPLPDTLTFSGEDPKTLDISFKCYLDEEKPDAIELFAIGDWSQYAPVSP